MYVRRYVVRRFAIHVWTSVSLPGVGQRGGEIGGTDEDVFGSRRGHPCGQRPLQRRIREELVVVDLSEH